MENKIIQGDCAEVMGTLSDESIDLVVTSPPYDNLRDYKGYSFNFHAIAKELYRVIKQGGVIVWVIADATIDGSETGTSFIQAMSFMELGLNMHDTMIWQKSTPPLTHNRYEQHFEYMFILSKGKPKTFNPLRERKTYNDRRGDKVMRREKDGSFDKGRYSESPDKILGNVWKIDQQYGVDTLDKFAFQHPAIFPEQLAKRHILSWSNEGDVVLDPMCGSGTTLKMAKELGRKYIGIEMSGEYCRLAEQRVAQEVLF
jgi:DNA modification methylase